MADFLNRNKDKKDKKESSEEVEVIETPIPEPEYKPQTTYKPIAKKKLKIMLISPKGYCVVDDNGNGRSIRGDFSKYKQGDFIEVDN